MSTWIEWWKHLGLLQAKHSRCLHNCLSQLGNRSKYNFFLFIFTLKLKPICETFQQLPVVPDEEMYSSNGYVGYGSYEECETYKYVAQACFRLGQGDNITCAMDFDYDCEDVNYGGGNYTDWTIVGNAANANESAAIDDCYLMSQYTNWVYFLNLKKKT